MSRNERIALWIVVALLAAGLVVLSAIVAGELAEIERHLLALAGGETGVDEPGADDPWWSSPASATAQPAAPPPARDATAAGVAVGGVEVLADSVALTVTVRAYGAGDLLFEPPALVSEEGVVYPATGDALAEARLAFLDLVTRGEATARLEFAGRLAPTAGLWLSFNPGQEPGNAVAPPLSVAVPLGAGVESEEDR